VAWVLVQLKLRLLLGALRASNAARVSFILSSTLALFLAIGTFAGLAALRHNGAAVDLTAVIYTLYALGWVILPLVAFGLDGTLDPATLVLYPLRTRPLVIGLLAASATGAWPLASLIGSLGITVGLAHGALAVLIAVIAAAVQVLFCIILARLVTTALAGLMRSRRGRDLAALAIIPIFALYEVFAQVLPRAIGKHELTAASFAGVDGWVRWLPPGLAAHAAQDASTGHAGTAVLRLLLAAAVTVVLGWLWASALSHALVTADASTQAATIKGGTLPFGRRAGLSGTIAARVLAYQRRDPTFMAYLGITVVLMVVVAISSLRGSHPEVGVLLSAGVGGASVGMQRGDSFGLDGPACQRAAGHGPRPGRDRRWPGDRRPILRHAAVPDGAAGGQPAAPAGGGLRDAVAGRPVRRADRNGDPGDPGHRRHRGNRLGGRRDPGPRSHRRRRRLRRPAGLGGHRPGGGPSRSQAARALPACRPQQALGSSHRAGYCGRRRSASAAASSAASSPKPTPIAWSSRRFSWCTSRENTSRSASVGSPPKGSARG